MTPSVMRLGLAAVTLAATAGSARADSRVSLEASGLYAYSPVDDGGAGGVRSINTANGGGSLTMLPMPTSGIAGVDVRPVFSLAGGLRVSIGFRAGSGVGGDATSGANESVSLIGGDVSVGYGRIFGRFLPFAEVRGGFNNYEVSLGQNAFHTHFDQLRLDAVVGARVYVTQAWYLSGSAFAGWGDQYGGAIGLGFDIVHYRARGALP